MPKINQKEYDILKGLDDKWKWIARDSDSPGKWYANSLEVYTDKPEKTEDTVWTNGNGSEKLNKDFFQFIQWSDEEPYNIAELIEEYEDEEYGYFNMKLSREYEQFIEESEETEVKNIEWLKKEVNELPVKFFGFSVLKQREEFAVIKDDVLDLINQLDEPETLSQEWIKDNTFYNSYVSEGGFIFVDDLKNLLVPKWELPVIPQFVADEIERYKKRGDGLWDFVYDYEKGVRSELKLYDWIFNGEESVEEMYEKQEVISKAFIYGYEVEEEQKYLLKHNGKYLKSVKVKTHHGREKLEELNIHLGYTAKEYAQIFTKEQKEHIEKHINIEVEELEE